MGAELLAAAEKGDHGMVERLLAENGADPDWMDEDKETAMHKAAQNGHKDVVVALVFAGANPNLQDAGGCALTPAPLVRALKLGAPRSAPLHDAALYDSKGVVATLFLPGIEIDVAVRNKAGETPLHVAARSGSMGVLSLLLDRSGVLVSCEDAGKETPLHKAASYDQADAVSALIKAGAKVNARDDAGETPLHDAAKDGSVAAVEALLAGGADTEATDNEGHTPLGGAVEAGEVEVVRALLAAAGADPNGRGDRNTPTPLQAAARAGNAEIVGLIAGAVAGAGGSLDLPDPTGMTALHLACAGGHGAAIEALIAAGADANAVTPGGETPLLCAVSGPGADAAVTAVLGGGTADPNYRSPSGERALHAAVRRGKSGAVRALLLWARQEILQSNLHEFVDGEKRYALALAVERSDADCARELVLGGADVLLLHRDAELRGAPPPGALPAAMLPAVFPLHAACAADDAALVQEILQSSLVVAARNEAGRNAAHEAAASGGTASLRCILEDGRIKVDEDDNAGDTVMSLSSRCGSRECVELLLRSGMGIDHKGSSGVTALLAAIDEDHKELVSFLMALGSDVNASTSMGVTALHIAAGHGDVELVRALTEAGALGMMNAAGSYPVAPGGTGAMAELLSAAVEAGHEVRREKSRLAWNDAHQHYQKTTSAAMVAFLDTAMEEGYKIKIGGAANIT